MSTIYFPEDFESFDGVEVFREWWSIDRSLRLLEDGNCGQFSRTYYGKSAKFTVAATGQNKTTAGFLTMELYVNSEYIDSFEFPANSDGQETGKTVKSISGVDIPQYSILNFRVKGNSSNSWTIENIKLIPEIILRKKQRPLSKAKTLKVYEKVEEQHAGYSMLQQFVEKNIKEQMLERDSILSKLNKPADWQAYQKKVRDRLPSIFGAFPEKSHLNPRIVGRIDYPDYYIEKVIYESLPGYYVPANLYIPKNRDFPLPGVLYTMGHSDIGKAATLYQMNCIGLVRKGYIVLASEPMGQGERIEYYNSETLEPDGRICMDKAHVSVAQHYYLGRPSFLVDWTLAGLRTWDCIRALDYLELRQEVNNDMLAVTGNSGGGQMALLVAAVDERIKVVAAAHPGGPMENIYLTGSSITEHDLLCLIPPRFCKIVVGKDSGEEPMHRLKFDDMTQFYIGLNADDHLKMEIVDGVHNNKLPKRQSIYAWLNQCFDKTEEGTGEKHVETEQAKTLWCTTNGIVLASLGGESGQTLNQKRLEVIYHPTEDKNELQDRITSRLKMGKIKQEKVSFENRGSLKVDGISVEKIIYESEKDIEIPALLFKPSTPHQKNSWILHVSDEGKPGDQSNSSLPFFLSKIGYHVLSIDIRGKGETLNLPPENHDDNFAAYSRVQYERDRLAIEALSFGRTMLGMQALDLVRGYDLITELLEENADDSVIIIGEGMGGILALLNNIYRPDAKAIITVNTLTSYKLLVSNKIYDFQDYFWVPGALTDYDIPDIAGLAPSSFQLWIDPVNELSDPISINTAEGYFQHVDDINIAFTSSGQMTEIFGVVQSYLQMLN